MQKKVLLSSILVIALCFSVIAGSTYALFTDKAQTSIAITSGDVEVNAWLSLDAVYSAKARQNQNAAQENPFLIDEIGRKYDHDEQDDGNFVNGGTASIDPNGATITLTNITPGDKIDATLFVENPADNNNVDMIYRYTISTNDGDLARRMVVTVENGESYEAAKSYTSAWSDTVEPGSGVKAHKFSIELPVYVPSEDENGVYEGQGVDYTITVEAIQANAAIYSVDTIDVVEFLDGKIDLNGRTLSDKAGVVNNGNVILANGTLAINEVGFENYGTAELNGLVIDAGTPGVNYAYGYGIIGQAGSTTILNDVELVSHNGALAANGGAHLVINSGNYEVDSANTSGRYMVYAVGDGTLVEITGGSFNFDTDLTLKRAYAYVGKGATLLISGGNFGAPSTRGDYKQGLLGEGTIIITGGTFGFDPTAWVADGCKVVKEGKTWTVMPVDLADIKDALANGEDVVLGSDVVAENRTEYGSNGNGAAAINVKNQVFDGNGNVVYAPGANTTWDSAIAVSGGTVKNVTVASGFRGIMVTKGDKVYLENVIIDGTVYTISCDSASNNGLEATNCTFNGWTSYAGTIGAVKFTDCSFGEGQGYAFCRPYAATEFVGCDFEAGFAIDARAAVTFENCTIAGEPLTAENLATLVTSNIANASVK